MLLLGSVFGCGRLAAANTWDAGTGRNISRVALHVVLKATCGPKLDHGVFAVDHGITRNDFMVDVGSKDFHSLAGFMPAARVSRHRHRTPSFLLFETGRAQLHAVRSSTTADARTLRCGQGSRLRCPRFWRSQFGARRVPLCESGGTQRLSTASQVVREQTRDDPTLKRTGAPWAGNPKTPAPNCRITTHRSRGVGSPRVAAPLTTFSETLGQWEHRAVTCTCLW